MMSHLPAFGNSNAGVNNYLDTCQTCLIALTTIPPTTFLVRIKQGRSLFNLVSHLTLVYLFQQARAGHKVQRRMRFTFLPRTAYSLDISNPIRGASCSRRPFSHGVLPTGTSIKKPQDEPHQLLGEVARLGFHAIPRATYPSKSPPPLFSRALGIHSKIAGSLHLFAFADGKPRETWSNEVNHTQPQGRILPPRRPLYLQRGGFPHAAPGVRHHRAVAQAPEYSGPSRQANWHQAW